jgi:hypothetical protein
MEEVKVPEPDPLLVFVLKDIVGVELVDHTTPRSVTVAPPSDEILPPERAVVDLIESIVIVEIVGIITVVTEPVSLRQRTE